MQLFQLQAFLCRQQLPIAVAHMVIDAHGLHQFWFQSWPVHVFYSLDNHAWCWLVR